MQYSHSQNKATLRHDFKSVLINVHVVYNLSGPAYKNITSLTCCSSPSDLKTGSNEILDELKQLLQSSHSAQLTCVHSSQCIVSDQHLEGDLQTCMTLVKSGTQCCAVTLLHSGGR